MVKKLHYAAEDMAQVGKVGFWFSTNRRGKADRRRQPLCDIDVQSDAGLEDEVVTTPAPGQAVSKASPQQPKKATEPNGYQPADADDIGEMKAATGGGKHGSLATPAVRGVLKELDVNIADVTGTGRDGRVLKDDVLKFATSRDQSSSPISRGSSFRPSAKDHSPQTETSTALTPIQSQMFKSMTRSLTIPHLLYADEIDITTISTLRKRINVHPVNTQKLSYLPFIIKAVSLALEDFPLVNARVEVGNAQEAPQLIMREKHNVGVAMDTPQGLLVPNVKDVSSLSILEIASELTRLQSSAREGKLSISDMTGGTITVSNIGSIGGTYVAPVLVRSEVAILGIGRAKLVPAFDDNDRVVKKEAINFSWSADHRVIDGATMARMAERVRGLIEEPGLMIARLS